jgi:hypothetical protein
MNGYHVRLESNGRLIGRYISTRSIRTGQTVEYGSVKYLVVGTQYDGDKCTAEVRPTES